MAADEKKARRRQNEKTVREKKKKRLVYKRNDERRGDSGRCSLCIVCARRGLRVCASWAAAVLQPFFTCTIACTMIVMANRSRT